MSRAAEREALIEDNRLLIRELQHARAKLAAQVGALARLQRAIQPFVSAYRRAADAPRSSVGWRTVTLREQDGDAILAALSATPYPAGTDLEEAATEGWPQPAAVCAHDGGVIIGSLPGQTAIRRQCFQCGSDLGAVPR